MIAILNKLNDGLKSNIDDNDDQNSNIAIMLNSVSTSSTFISTAVHYYNNKLSADCTSSVSVVSVASVASV